MKNSPANSIPVAKTTLVVMMMADRFAHCCPSCFGLYSFSNTKISLFVPVKRYPAFSSWCTLAKIGGVGGAGSSLRESRWCRTGLYGVNETVGWPCSSKITAYCRASLSLGPAPVLLARCGVKNVFLASVLGKRDPFCVASFLRAENFAASSVSNLSFSCFNALRAAAAAWLIWGRFAIPVRVPLGNKLGNNHYLLIQVQFVITIQPLDFTTVTAVA